MSATRSAGRTIAEAVGISVDPDAFTHWYDEVQRANDEAIERIPYEERWRRLLDGALGAAVLPERLAAFVERVRGRTGHEPLFSDVRNCLDRLREVGQRLAVVSNSRSEPHIRGHPRAGRDLPYFELTVSSGTEGVAKPDPEIFLRAVLRLGLPPFEVCYVGDLRNVDARAARAAGLRSLWLNRGGTGFSDEPWEITSLSEVPAAVARGDGGDRPSRGSGAPPGHGAGWAVRTRSTSPATQEEEPGVERQQRVLHRRPAGGDRSLANSSPRIPIREQEGERPSREVERALIDREPPHEARRRERREKLEEEDRPALKCHSVVEPGRSEMITRTKVTTVAAPTRLVASATAATGRRRDLGHRAAHPLQRL